MQPHIFVVSESELVVIVTGIAIFGYRTTLSIWFENVSNQLLENEIKINLII